MIQLKNVEILDLSGKHKVLEVEDLAFPEKGFLVLLGENGSGKTTFLKSLCGLNSHYKGEISLNGKSLNTMSLMEKSTWVQFVDVQNSVPAFMNVIEFIELGQSHINNLDEIIKDLELKHLASRMVSSLSKGQLQKVIIAKLLVSNASILLLDEPNNYLDYKVEKIVWDRLKKEAQSRLVICTVHHLKTAAELKSQILFIRSGKLSNIKSPQTEDSLRELLS